MASFNLTAELNLRGPSNLNQVVSNIRRQLSTISLNLNINPSTSRGIQAVTADVRNLSVALRDAQANAVALNTTLRGLGASTSNISRATSSLGSNLSSISSGASSTGKAIKAASSEMTEFGRQSALAVRRFAAFSVATGAIYALSRAITSAYGEFVTFNKEFVRLQQVTESTVSGLASLSGEITRLSTSLGVSSQELLTVSVTLAQAGLSAGETKTALEALAKSALAPSFDSLNDTVEGSIALMRQFGISASDLEGSLGSINAVAAKFAVEAGDIIAAIQRTGGVFANASKGVSEGKDALNEFLAVFTSVRATTRESAETIATGLRTIFTRIQRTDTIDALKQYGIQLTDLEGKFVGPYEAVRRLSEGLKLLDPRDLRFSSIVEELGGFRQIGKVIPLIQQFESAQKALGVAQRGTGSLALDAATAQEALSVRINKVREQFVALIRDIGQSQGFQTFVDISLKLAGALISVADAAKSVLPAIAAITAIRGVGALGQFFGGFSGGLGRNKPRGFATGGYVPGSGNRDTVPAALTPGEFVIRKKAVQRIGVGNLARLNRNNGGPVPTQYFNEGGQVQKFMGGKFVMPKARGTKGARGARGPRGFEPLSSEEYLKWTREIYKQWDNDPSLPRENYLGIPMPKPIADYQKKIRKYALESGGAGLALGRDSKGREVIAKFGKAKQEKIESEGKLKKTDLGLFMSAAGYNRGLRAPETAKTASYAKFNQAANIKPKFIAWGRGQGSFRDIVAGSEDKIRSGLSGTNLTNFNNLLQAESLDTYKAMGGKDGHIPPLKKAIYQIMGITGKNLGGYIQKFNKGGKVPLEDKIQKGMIDNNVYKFGLVGLQSGTGAPIKDIQDIPDFTRGKAKKDGGQGIKKYKVQLHRSTFFPGVGSEDDKKTIESNIEKSFVNMVNQTSATMATSLKSSKSANPATTKKILTGAPLSTIVGTVFEAALASLGSPFINKPEKAKSIDFPLGLGSVAQDFGIPPNIPTDATRTIAGSGKSVSNMKAQIGRFIGSVENQEFSKGFAAKFNKTDSQIKNVILGNLQSSPESASAIVSRVNTELQKSNVTVGSTGLPLSLGEKALKTAISRGTINALPGPIQGILKRLYGKDLERRAMGGSISGEDTVPALLTPGEFVINKKAARSIGSAKLNRLNKADKISGFNKGGAVGHIQKFAAGGRPLPARPNTQTPINMIVPPNTVQALQEIVKALENMGVSASESARLLERGGSISVQASERAYQEDLNRLRIAGASASDIYNAEQRLAEVRVQNARQINTAREFTELTGGQLQDIQSGAELGRDRIIANRRSVMQARGRSADEIDAAIADPEFQDYARRTAFERSTASVTGRSTRDLQRVGIGGQDIEAYINRSSMDFGTLRQMDEQLLETRRQQLRNETSYSTASSAQQRRMMRELTVRTNEEIAARRDIVNQLRRDRGMSSGFLGREGAGISRVLGIGQTSMSLLGMGGPLREDAFGQGARGGRFARGFNRMSSGMQGAGMGLTFAGGMIGDTVGKAVGGKEGQAISSAVSAFVGSAGIGMMFGPIGALTGVVVGATAAIQSWKDSIIDATLQEEAEKIESAQQKVNQSFEKISKTKTPQEAQLALKEAAQQFQKISVSEAKRQDQIADRVLPSEPGFFSGIFRSLTGARGKGYDWDPTGYSGRLIDPAELKMDQAEKEIIASAKQSNILQYLPQQFESGTQKGLSVQQVEASFPPGELDRLKELFAVASGDIVLSGLVSKRESMEKRKREGVQGIDTTNIDAAIKNISNKIFNQEFLKGLQDRSKAEQDMAAMAAAATIEINLLNQSLSKISSAADKAAVQFEETQRQMSIQRSVMFGGGGIQGPDRSQENVLNNIMAYSVAEIRDLIGRIGSDLQFNPALTKEAQNAAVAQKVLQQELPKILAEVGAREGDSFDPESSSADTIKKKLSEALTGFLPAERLKEIVNNFAKNFQARLKNRKGTTVEEIAEDDGALRSLIEYVPGVLEAFGASLNQTNDIVAKVNEGMNAWVSDMATATDIRIDAQNISIEAGNQLSKVLGEELSLGDMNQAFESTIGSLTQRIGAGGAGIPGTGTLDPATIMQRMLDKETEARNIQSQLDAEKPVVGSARFNELSESLKRAKLEASNLSKAHQKLQNDSSRAANALTKIGELRQLQETRQNSFLDVLKNINNPEAMMEFTNEIEKFFAQMAGQGTVQNIPQAIAGLERQMAVLPAEQAQTVREDFIRSIRDTLIAQRDGSGAPRFSAEMIDAIVQNIGADGNVSPEMRGLINEFYKYTEVQKNASEQAANQLVIGAIKAADSLEQGAKNAMMVMGAGGQDNPRQNIPLQPQKRQNGGLIYASQGQYVNFQPRGSDTVPAMLTPGEFVVNAKATKQNRGLLESINGGKIGGYNRGGMVYLNAGGYVPKDTTIDADAAALQAEMDAIYAKLDDQLAQVNSILEPLIEQHSAVPAGPQNDLQRRQIWEQLSPLYSQRDALFAQKASVLNTYMPRLSELQQRRSAENDRKIAATGQLSGMDIMHLNLEEVPGSHLGLKYSERNNDKWSVREDKMTPEEKKQYAKYREEKDKRVKERIDLARARVAEADTPAQNAAMPAQNPTMPANQVRQQAVVQQQTQGAKPNREKINEERRAAVAEEKARRRQAFLDSNPYYKKKEEEKASKKQQEIETAQRWYIKQNTSSDGSWAGHIDPKTGKPGVPENVLTQYKKNEAEKRKQESKERLLYGSTVNPLDPKAKEKREAAINATPEQIAEQNKIRRGQDLARRFKWALPDTKPSGTVVGQYEGYERGEEPFELRRLSAEDRQALDDFQMAHLASVEKAQRDRAAAEDRKTSEERWEQTKQQIGIAAQKEREIKDKEEQRTIAKREQAAQQFREMRRQEQAERDQKWYAEKSSKKMGDSMYEENQRSSKQLEIQQRRQEIATNKEEQTDRIQDMVSTVAIPELDNKKVRQLFDEPEEITRVDQKTNIPETTGVDVRIDPITGRPIDTRLDPRLLSGQLNQTLADLERLRVEQYFNNETSSTASIEQMLKDEYAAAMAEIDRRKASGEFGKSRKAGDAEREARSEAGKKTRLGQFYSEQGGALFVAPEDYASKYIDSMSRQEKEQLRKERREQLAEQQRTLKEQGKTTAVQLAESKKAQAAELERKQTRIAETEKEFKQLKRKAETRPLDSLERTMLAEMAVDRGPKVAKDVNLFAGDLSSAEDSIRRRALTDQEFRSARMREQKENAARAAADRDALAARAFMPASNFLQLGYLAAGYGSGAVSGLDAQDRKEWGKTQTDENLSSGVLGWTGAALDMAMPLGPIDDVARVFNVGKTVSKFGGKKFTDGIKTAVKKYKALDTAIARNAAEEAIDFRTGTQRLLNPKTGKVERVSDDLVDVYRRNPEEYYRMQADAEARVRGKNFEYRNQVLREKTQAAVDKAQDVKAGNIFEELDVLDSFQDGLSPMQRSIVEANSGVTKPVTSPLPQPRPTTSTTKASGSKKTKMDPRFGGTSLMEAAEKTPTNISFKDLPPGSAAVQEAAERKAATQSRQAALERKKLLEEGSENSKKEAEKLAAEAAEQEKKSKTPIYKYSGVTKDVKGARAAEKAAEIKAKAKAAEAQAEMMRLQSEASEATSSSVSAQPRTKARGRGKASIDPMEGKKTPAQMRAEIQAEAERIRMSGETKVGGSTTSKPTVEATQPKPPATMAASSPVKTATSQAGKAFATKTTRFQPSVEELSGVQKKLEEAIPADPRLTRSHTWVGKGGTPEQGLGPSKVAGFKGSLRPSGSNLEEYTANSLRIQKWLHENAPGQFKSYEDFFRFYNPKGSRGEISGLAKRMEKELEGAYDTGFKYENDIGTLSEEFVPGISGRFDLSTGSKEIQDKLMGITPAASRQTVDTLSAKELTALNVNRKNLQSIDSGVSPMTRMDLTYGQGLSETVLARVSAIKEKMSRLNQSSPEYSSLATKLTEEEERVRRKVAEIIPEYRKFGGLIYANKGTLVPYQPRGTDTVPAMLTPGEFVVNRKSAKQNMGLLKAINKGQNVQPLGFNRGGIVPTQYYEAGSNGPVSGGSSSGGGVSNISVDASALDAAFSNFSSYVSSLSSVIDGFTQGTTELAGLSQAIGALGNLGLREGASLMANAGTSVKEATTSLSSAMTAFNTSATSLATAISTIPQSISLTVSGSIPVTVSVQIEGGSGTGTDTSAIEQSIMDKVALAINSATQGGISIDTAIS